MSNGEECPGLSATPECTETSTNISEVTQSSPAPVPEALDAHSSVMEGHVGHCRGALALCQAQSLRPHTPWNPHSSSRESPLSLPLFCRQGKAKAQRGYVTFPVSHSQSSQSWYLGQGLLETKDLTLCYPGRAQVRRESVSILPQRLLLAPAPSATVSSASGPSCSQVHPEPGLVPSEEGDHLASTFPLVAIRWPLSCVGGRAEACNCPQIWGRGKHRGFRVRRPGVCPGSTQVPCMANLRSPRPFSGWHPHLQGSGHHG